jgi:hypothetical protein
MPLNARIDGTIADTSRQPTRAYGSDAALISLVSNGTNEKLLKILAGQVNGETIQDEAPWIGFNLFAKLAYGTMAILLLLSAYSIDTGRSCVVQFGEGDCSVPVPININVANGMLWFVVSGAFAAAMLLSRTRTTSTIVPGVRS